MTTPEDQPAPKAHAELPSYSLEDEEAAGWRKWLRGRRLVLGLSLFAFVLAVAFGAKPLYREIKARRALSIVEQAGAAIDRGAAPEASVLLRQAALMAFQDKRVAERLIYQAARGGDMASVAEIGRKIAGGNASPEEIIVFAEKSLATGRIADVTLALQKIPADLSAAQSAKRTALEAGLLAAQGRTAEAEAALRKGIASDAPEGDELRIMLANLLLSGKNDSRTEEARQLLETVAQRDGGDALPALRALAASQAGSSPSAPGQLEATIERLRRHPDSSAADELFIARLIVSSHPDQQKQTVQDLVARLRERGASVDDRVAVARWLVGIQAPEAVLELVGPEDAAKHAGALMARIDALSALDRWDECSETIETNRGGTVPDTLYYLFRARIAATRGDRAAEENEKRQLRQVMQFAELPHVLFAARYAETCGWKPEAFAAWRIIASDSNAKADALRGQIRNLPPTAKASDGLDLANELLVVLPGDPSARLSAAFFALLAQKDVAASAAAAEEFLAGEPESADVRRVAALGRLRTGQAQAGLKILPADNGEPRWQALRAALLRTAGQKSAAEKVSGGIDTSSLLPEERELLK